MGFAPVDSIPYLLPNPDRIARTPDASIGRLKAEAVHTGRIDGNPLEQMDRLVACRNLPERFVVQKDLIPGQGSVGTVQINILATHRDLESLADSDNRRDEPVNGVDLPPKYWQTRPFGSQEIDLSLQVDIERKQKLVGG